VKHNKNGFFLIELMIGLSISTFFILIITHYIIEVKVTQQKALKCAEKVSVLRNQKERDFVKKYGTMYA
jgi:Tfp pilus assembly protein PilW